MEDATVSRLLETNVYAEKEDIINARNKHYLAAINEALDESVGQKMSAYF